MHIVSTYKTKIIETEYNSCFHATVEWYRKAVSFFIPVVLAEWDWLAMLSGTSLLSFVEFLSVKTKDNPNPKYNFTDYMYKYPCYYRRAAINQAIGKVSSYKSNLANWENTHQGERPGIPKAGYVYPALYRQVCVKECIGDCYHVQIKVWIRNTWDWVTVKLRKSDVDYIRHHCEGRKSCVPTLRKRGKKWFLDFAFEEDVKLVDIPIQKQTILAVDLGINSACVCTAMQADGTILGRKFLHLPKEEDSLRHALNRIKKAQKNGARKTPELWACAKGINDHISVLTAQFIVDTAVLYSAFTVVFEHLETRGRKRGSRSKRQRIQHWRSQYVQNIVADKAHRLGIRISKICAWNTSRLAFDGSGEVRRGREAGFPNNATCQFQNSKVYNCDLNASYNIGARYFIREILKSLPATSRLRVEAKVPQCSKRSTSTYATLISLCAELHAAA